MAFVCSSFPKYVNMLYYNREMYDVCHNVWQSQCGELTDEVTVGSRKATTCWGGDEGFCQEFVIKGPYQIF